MISVVRPKVYLVGRPSINEDGMQEFLRDHKIPDWSTDTVKSAEILPEVAGRMCYMSFANPRPGGNLSYLENIKSVQHGSVLEHSYWNFIIVGVSRSFTHELVRHRAGTAFSQRSQRYVDESEAFFVEPECISENKEIHDEWIKCVESAQSVYIKMVEALNDKFSDVENKTLRRKLARQSARSVLPNATETKIFFSANARSLRHIIELRCNEHAETEIRIVFGMVLEILQKEAPSIFGDYEKRMLPDGTFEAFTKFRKV